MCLSFQAFKVISIIFGIQCAYYVILHTHCIYVCFSAFLNSIPNFSQHKSFTHTLSHTLGLCSTVPINKNRRFIQYTHTHIHIYFKIHSRCDDFDFNA